MHEPVPEPTLTPLQGPSEAMTELQKVLDPELYEQVFMFTQPAVPLKTQLTLFDWQSESFSATVFDVQT